MYENNVVIATDLNDAWRQSLECCSKNGIDYKIEKGSYAGEYRRQLEHLTLIIESPSRRPFNFYVPQGIPSPADQEAIDEYFTNYIIGDKRSDKEDYTYANYITLQYDRLVKILNESEGFTNQAIITIGECNSINLQDPPCLRSIAFKRYRNKLQATLYFRSWDLFSGLPLNLSGIQMLKESIIMDLNFDIEDGPMVVFSDGGHIYGMYSSVINQLNANTIEIKGEQ